MAEDLMQFSSFKQDENVGPESDEEAPQLAQPSVIVNSILKQSDKDNLIQLYTPVHKDKQKLKVHFGTPKILETPRVPPGQQQHRLEMNETLETTIEMAEDSLHLASMTVEVPERAIVEEDEEEAWRDRTSVLTKQDHNDYCQYASEILTELVNNLPIKEELNGTCSSDSGIEDNGAAEAEVRSPDKSKQLPSLGANTELQPESDAIMSKADELLMQLQAITANITGGSQFPTPSSPPKSTAPVESETSVTPQPAVPEDRGEEMDTEEAMEVDDEPLSSMSQTSVVQWESRTRGSERSEIDQSRPQGPISTSKGQEEDNRGQVNQSAEDIENKENIKPVSDEVKMGVAADDTTKEAERLKFKTPEAENSSDEEYLSADEAMEVDDVSIIVESTPAVKVEAAAEMAEKTVPQVTAVIEKQLQTSTEEDPFKAGKQLANTPDSKPVNKKLLEKLEEIDPFQPSRQIMNSPDVKLSMEKIQEKHDKVNSSETVTWPSDKAVQLEQSQQEVAKSNTDPFPPSKQIMNSPVAKTTVVEETIKEIDSAQNLEPPQPDNSSPDKVSEPCTVVPQPELPTEEVNPFKPSKQIMNTPDGKQAPVPKEQDLLAEEDPFKPRKQIMNSPDVKSLKANEQHPFVATEEQQNDPARTVAEKDLVQVDKIDPFKPSTETMNSPAEKSVPERFIKQTDEVDPFKPSKQIMNSPDKISETALKEDSGEDSGVPEIVPDTEVKEVPVEEDPFKPAKEIINSPAPTPSVGVCHTVNEDDPFKPKTQIMNSPAIKSAQEDQDKDDIEIVDPFKPSKQIMNSPDAKSVSDNKTEDLAEEINPFQPSKQIMNSPDIKSAPVMENSVSVKENLRSKEEIISSEKDSLLMVETVEVPEETMTDVQDPFKPSKQVANSPDQKKTVCVPQEEPSFDDLDPFKPRKQMMNSPETKLKANESSLPDFADLDLFKPKKEMINSPDGKDTEIQVEAIVDDQASSQSNQCVNETDQPAESTEGEKETSENNTMEVVKNDEKETCVKAQSEEEIKEKPEHLPEEPLPKRGTYNFDDLDLDSIDPFKPKTQTVNSPAPITQVPEAPALENLEDIDPFKSKTQVANTPPAAKKESSVEKTVIPKKLEDILDGFENIDPFKPSKGLVNSPTGPSLTEENPFVSCSRVANSPEPMKDDPFSCASKIPEDKLSSQEPTSKPAARKSLGDILEVEGVVRKGSTATDVQGFDVDETQFVSASQVFSDPASWELLEQFGSKSAAPVSSELSRMSLYLKFDPLVQDAGQINPRRISIRPSQLEKVKELGLDETLLLLGSPFRERKKRQSLAQPPNMGEVDRLFSMADPIVEEPKTTKPKTTVEETVTGPVLDEEEWKAPGLVEELKYTEGEMKAMKQKMKMEFQGVLMTKEKELCKKLEEQQKNNQAIKKQNIALNEDKKKMIMVVEMYEETLMEMTVVKDKALQDCKNIAKEKEQALQDIQSVETAFSDLHRRYEKLKSVVNGFKKNEDMLKKYATEMQEKQKSAEEKMAKFRKLEEEKCQKMKEEIDKLKHQIETSEAKFEAMNKVKDVKINRLETDLKQKTVENKELTDICDNLLQKVQT